MSKKNLTESQQQGQGITIGTQGNEDQPTPHGDELNERRESENEGRHIPHQENSSATRQQRPGEGRGQNG